jgi:hypothetical protein
MRGGQKLLDMYKDPGSSNKAQRFLKGEVIRLINDLKIKGK